MQRNQIQKIFNLWRTENWHRFIYPMYQAGKRRRGHYSMSFAGIAAGIRLHLGPSGFEVWAHVQEGESGGDGLVEFDLQERRHPATRQYYCGFCSDLVYYDTRRELWIRHSFEPFLEWMNENFRPGKWLCLYGDSEWIWGVRILDESEMLEHRGSKADFYYATPVVKPKGERVIVRKFDNQA